MLPPTEDELSLIHALQIAPRASWTQLAPILGNTPTTLSARWQRLRAARIAWIFGHTGGNLPERCTAFIEVDLDPEQSAAACAALCQLPEAQSVQSGGSSSEILLTCIGHNWADMVRRILPTIRALPGVIRVRPALLTRLFASGEHWRLDSLRPDQQDRVRRLTPSPRPRGSHLPRASDRMLPLLQRDGRASIEALATAAGYAPSTAARHLTAALETERIQLRCEIGAYHSGHPLVVLWRARVPGRLLGESIETLRSLRTLRLLATVTGPANLLFMLQVRTPAALADVERRLGEVLPFLDIVETIAGVRSWKRMGWLLDRDELPTGEVIPLR